MPTSIQIAAANFTYFIDRVPPFYSDAAGLWFMGPEEDSKRNLVTGLDGTVIGDPNFGPTYAEFTYNDGIDTGISLALNEDKTFIVVGLGGIVGYAGTWHSGRDHALLYSSDSTSVRTAMLGSGQIGATGVPIGGVVRFMASTYDNTSGKQAVYASDGGKFVSNTGSRGPSSLTATNTFRLGACGLESHTGSYQCYAAMLFRRALSEQELGFVYDYMKFKLRRRGIFVA